MQSPILSSEWLKEHLSDPDLIILDASQPGNISGKKSGRENAFIAKSRHFDLKNTFSDQNSKWPNMLPSPEDFQTEARKLGINSDSKIIVYDNLGIYNSPRVWWMFKTMGHDSIAVLDGGLPGWIAERGMCVDELAESVTEGNFTAAFNNSNVVDVERITKNIDHPDFIVIDARSKGRFDGTAPEPREGMKSGHIPGSLNLPFQEVLENGKMKRKEELRSIFSQLKMGNKPVVFSCGSGLTACVDLLACELVMDNKKAVYDGSWTEWTQTKGALIAP